VWNLDVPHPTTPEYKEHHEGIQQILGFVDNNLLKGSLKEQFIYECSLIKKPRLLVLAIKLPTGAIETISNTNDIESKINYIDASYNDDLCLKGQIQIEGWLIL
jgi:hypothetical protein